MRKHLRLPIRNFCMSISKAKKRGNKKSPLFFCAICALTGPGPQFEYMEVFAMRMALSQLMMIFWQITGRKG